MSTVKCNMDNTPQTFTIPSYEDFRGYLSVVYDRDIPFEVRQINQGYSKAAYTLRGLHFQSEPYAQAKLVTCLHGSIFNVAVDIRPGAGFGRAYTEVLSFENRKMMYIPRGYAHGYLTLEDDTLMQWCTDNDFCAGAAHAIKYDDPDIIWTGASWLDTSCLAASCQGTTCNGASCNAGRYIVSEKDRNGMKLKDILK